MDQLIDILHDREAPTVKLTVQMSVDSEIEAIESFEHTDLIELYTWLCQVLRIENSPIGRSLLRIVTKSVYFEAAKLGYEDAVLGHAQKPEKRWLPIWTAGYADGWAIGGRERERS